MARLSLISTPSCEGVAPSGVLLRRRAALFVTVRIMDGLRQPAPGGQPVLAATRSPAARVRCLLATPAGAGPLHTSRRNRFASPMGADNYRYILL
jgi:hypothetical protein